ncbi:bacteriohemerythrin [Candidatus Riflebacteria bacterium]
MSFFEWQEEYSVKVKIFDDQHKELFGLIDKLQNAIVAGKGNNIINSVFTELFDYCISHFKLEEQHMKDYVYPDFESHRTHHNKFLVKIMKFKKESEDGKPILALAVLKFLKSWWVSHILKRDKEYSEFFNAKGLF